jgi:hypothetical protein
VGNLPLGKYLFFDQHEITLGNNTKLKCVIFSEEKKSKERKAKIRFLFGSFLEILFNESNDRTFAKFRRLCFCSMNQHSGFKNKLSGA